MSWVNIIQPIYGRPICVIDVCVQHVYYPRGLLHSTNICMHVCIGFEWFLCKMYKNVIHKKSMYYKKHKTAWAVCMYICPLSRIHNTSHTAWARDIRRCEYSRGANSEASSDWINAWQCISSHAQRRTAKRPATETKVCMSKEHATQLSTARRLAVPATDLRGL
jgi:hypothetical protein